MKWRSRHILHSAVAAVLVAVMWPCTVKAQEAEDTAEGPIIVGQRPTFDKLHIDPTEFTLDLVGTYQHEKSQSGGVTSEAKQFQFIESLGLETHGYVIHPNFIDFNLAGSFGLSETLFSSNGDSSTSYGTVYTWDASATLFRNSDSPLTVYSRREDQWFFREFGSAIESISTDTGANLDLRSNGVNTHMGLSHMEATQSGSSDFDNLSYTRDVFSWFSSAHPTYDQTLTWSYNYASVDQTGVTSSSYQTQDATLSHEALFGEKNRSRLTSTLNYSQQSGLSNYDHFRWSEQLNLHHSDTFRTRYNYTLDQFDINDSQRTNQRAEASFTHYLYKSLTTNGNIGMQKMDSSGDFGSTETFANINWDYRKTIPYGLFSANLGLGWSRTENESTSSTTHVIDQLATFTDPQPIVLTGTNLVPSSIIITDPSGLLLYQPGIDYTVTSFPNYLEINRVIGGSINNNSAVLIDYDLAPQAANTVDTHSFSLGSRYDILEGPLKGLALYARYAKQDQTIESSSPSTFVPSSYTDVTYGTEYRIWDFTIGAERQFHDSTIMPFDATRYWGRYQHRVNETTYSLNSAYTNLQYTNNDNKIDLYTVSARVDHRFSNQLYGSATLLWRDETNNLYGDTRGTEEQLELRWNHRQTEAYIQLRSAQLETVGQDNNFEFLQIGIRRKF